MLKVPDNWIKGNKHIPKSFFQEYDENGLIKKENS